MAGQGIAIEELLVDGVVRQRVGVIGVRMATRDPEDPLRQQIAQGVVDPRWVPRIGEDGRESINQPHASIDPLEQHGASIGTGVGLIEAPLERPERLILKQQRLCYCRGHHGRLRCTFRLFITPKYTRGVARVSIRASFLVNYSS